MVSHIYKFTSQCHSRTTPSDYLSPPYWPVEANCFWLFLCFCLENTGIEPYSEYTGVWNDVFIQFFVCFFSIQFLFILFWSWWSSGLIWDLSFPWQSVMWYIIINITYLVRKINNVVWWQGTLLRLGDCFWEMKIKCWVTLILYNAWHYDYVYWNKLICMFVTANDLLFNFVRG